MARHSRGMFSMLDLESKAFPWQQRLSTLGGEMIRARKVWMRTTRKRALLWLLVLVAVVMTTQMTLHLILSHDFASSRTDDSVPCKVVFIGKFLVQNSSVIQNYATIGIFENGGQCISACHTRKLRLASYDVINMCRCGQSLLTSATKWLLPNNAVMFVGEEVTLITHTCNRDETPQQLAGCLATNRDLLTFPTSRNSPPQCIESCEIRGFPLAGLSREKVCHCFRTNREITFNGTGSNLTTCSPGRRLAVWRTWAKNPDCSEKDFFTENSGLVGLVSFPGSGNTWLRQMLETVSGVYTGSLYNEKELFSKGFLGELVASENGRVRIVKDHLYRDRMKSLWKYNKVILLLRNPFDALVAEFHRRVSNDHVGHALPETFTTRDWSKFVIPLLEQWKSSAIRVAQSGIPLHVVYFEDLLESRIKEVKKILEFADFDLGNYEPRVSCLLTEDFGLYRRTRINPTTRIYSSGLTDLVNKAIAAVRNALLAKNCETCRSFPKNYELQPRDQSVVIDTSNDQGVGVIQV